MMLQLIRHTIFISLLLFVTAVHAQNNTNSGDQQQKVRAPTYHFLTKIHSLMAEEEYTLALQKIDDFYHHVEHIAVERALLNQTRAYILLTQERYPEAIILIEDILTENILATRTNNDLRFNLAQIYMQAGAYEKAITQLDIYLKTSQNKNTANAHALAGYAHYSLKQFKIAVEHLQNAISQNTVPQKGEKSEDNSNKTTNNINENNINENWYQILLASYYDLKDYKSASKLLYKLVALYPDNDLYWKQFSSVKLYLGQKQAALAGFELYSQVDSLQGDDLLRLARLNIFLDEPVNAAKTLLHALENESIDLNSENYTLAADSLILAREYKQALSILKKASKLAPENKQLKLRYAELSFQQEHWQNTIDLLRPLTKDKNQTIRARALLLQGISAYYLDNTSLSIISLKQASQLKQSRQLATIWLNQVKRGVELLKLENATNK